MQVDKIKHYVEFDSWCSYRSLCYFNVSCQSLKIINFDWLFNILFLCSFSLFQNGAHPQSSYYTLPSVEFSSVTQSCPTLCDPMNHSMPGLPVHHQLLEFTQTHVHPVMPSSHLILCYPLLLLPSIPPSIRVFSNESALLMRWPKYWSFSFNISPFNEHPGLICFRMDWLDLLAVQGTL